MTEKSLKPKKVSFEHANFCALSDTFTKQFDIVIAMDNALPHMLTSNDLASAIKSIVNQIKDGGMFVASIRDYDALLMDKPPYSPPYIHKTSPEQNTKSRCATRLFGIYKFVLSLKNIESNQHFWYN